MRKIPWKYFHASLLSIIREAFLPGTWHCKAFGISWMAFPPPSHCRVRKCFKNDNFCSSPQSSWWSTGGLSLQLGVTVYFEIPYPLHLLMVLFAFLVSLLYSRLTTIIDHTLYSFWSLMFCWLLCFTNM